MDPFKAVPVEIRLEILTSCNRQTVVAISHASPVLFRDRQLHRIQLAREFIAKDVLHDESLIQDAMAVVLFPFPDPDLPRSRKGQVNGIDGHLRLWRRKELPSFHRDGLLTLQVDSLCRQIRLYMEDYLTKATSEYLPDAYQRLPWWSSLSADPSRRLSAKETFDMDLLSRREHMAIFRAFLRYELMCSIYGVNGGPQVQILPDELDEDGEPSEIAESRRDRYAGWNWNVTQLAENQRDEVPLLACVRLYLDSLYRAAAVATLNPGHPPVPLDGLDPAGVYPWFHAALPQKDRLIEILESQSSITPENRHPIGHDSVGGMDWLPFGVLASSGFSAITKMLKLPTTSQHELHEFMFKLRSDLWQETQRGTLSRLRIYWGDSSIHIAPLQDDDDHGHISAPPDEKEVERRLRRHWQTYLFFYLYKLRAFPLFDDDRFYGNISLEPPTHLESGIPPQSIGGSAPPGRSANGTRDRGEKEAHIIRLPAAGSENFESIVAEFTRPNSLAGLHGARSFFVSNLEIMAGFDASEMVSLASFQGVKRVWEDGEGF